MLNVIDQLRGRARSNPRRIVFPETYDARVIKAASIFEELGLGKPILVVSRQKPPAADVGSFESVSLDDVDLADRCAAQLFDNRKHKGLSFEAAKQAIEDPVLFAALLVKIGHVDGSVAGSVATTASVIRSGLYGIGANPGRKMVSSFFLMQLADRAVTYSDCGVVPDPNPNQLAEIAITAAESHRVLSSEEPRVALLSFSTKGSADHPRVQKVRSALEIAKQMEPKLLIDGELQFDAAYVPSIANRKAPESPLQGNANVFIFPDLDAGNIAYKITERLCGAQALGPLIQGLQKPFMDLSRGCSVEDIVNVAVVASVLANED